MSLNKKQKKAKRAKRYFGIVKVRKGEKHCWLSHESKNGWSLGFALNSRTVWVKGLRFADRKEIERALTSGVVFVHLKNSKTVPNKKK